jgi:hypothetical protein
VKFTRQGEKATAQFTVTAPAVAGDFKVQAIAKTGDQEYKTGYTPSPILTLRRDTSIPRPNPKQKFSM